MISRFANVSPDKLRGGYYTAPDIAAWLCKWAIRSSKDRVLEPSCGNGAFLEAAAHRLRKLGARGPSVAAQVVGVEIMASEADKAYDALNRTLGVLGLAQVARGDFFEWMDKDVELFDCVVGNPPFIRYQNFPEPSRARAMTLLTTSGLRANKLTNIWVPFVVGAVRKLGPEGRLALVLPAELLQVSYAAQLRCYLADRFKRLEILACNHLLFDGAEQEVLLLLAEGRLQTPSPENRCRINLTQLHKVEDVLSWVQPNGRARGLKYIDHDSEKWLKYFLTGPEIAFMRALRGNARVATLAEHGDVDVGIVTGRNSFFVLDEKEVAGHSLHDFVQPVVGRSSQLRGAVLRSSELAGLGRSGHRVYLFSADPKNGALPDGVRQYVKLGEQRGDHKGYKCSIRDPWYAVPSVWRPDAFFFRQIYDFPRVVLNRAGATSTDTIHRLTCRRDAPLLVGNLYTHLTAASAEIEGRSYGGGVLELEPTEAERLLVPRQLVESMPLEEVDRLVRAGRLGEVLTENDRLVLRNGIGLSRRECASLGRIWDKMRERRVSRGKNGRADPSRAAAGPCTGQGTTPAPARETPRS